MFTEFCGKYRKSQMIAGSQYIMQEFRFSLTRAKKKNQKRREEKLLRELDGKCTYGKLVGCLKNNPSPSLPRPRVVILEHLRAQAVDHQPETPPPTPPPTTKQQFCARALEARFGNATCLPGGISDRGESRESREGRERG